MNPAHCSRAHLDHYEKCAWFIDLGPGEGTGEQRFVLPLDRTGRKFTVISPVIVTPQELKRIQDWLSSQLIVEKRTLEA